MSGEHGCLFILVEGGTGRFELVEGCWFHVAAKLHCPEFVYYVMCAVQCQSSVAKQLREASSNRNVLRRISPYRRKEHDAYSFSKN